MEGKKKTGNTRVKHITIIVFLLRIYTQRNPDERIKLGRGQLHTPSCQTTPIFKDKGRCSVFVCAGFQGGEGGS